MLTKTVIKKLKGLANAAEVQGAQPYDHGQAMADAGVKERGDKLTPLAAAWCLGLPPGVRTLIDWERKSQPTGREVSEMYRTACRRYQETGNSEAARDD